MTRAVEFEAVTKSFSGRQAVCDLSFQIPEGQLFGFIGPNGSGKTTSLRMMLGILYPSSGSLRVLGQTRYDAISDLTGYLPEERGLYRRMRVKDVLSFHAQLKNLRRPRVSIAHWLERLDLADRANSRVASLSKGLAQRVQFAAAVVHNPRLLVLDEPFSGLDPVSMDSLRELILELKRGGTTVVLSTHDMQSAERLCDAVVMLHRGRKVLDGSVPELKRRHGAECVRLRFAEDVGELHDEAVCRVRDYGNERLLELRAGADPQAVLARLMQRGQVLSFEVVRPSLHEIFVDIAGQRADETQAQAGSEERPSV